MANGKSHEHIKKLYSPRNVYTKKQSYVIFNINTIYPSVFRNFN
jgi:hypothetical protein